MRYAKTDSPGDSNRSLNKKGRRDVKIMIEVLRKKEVRPDLIISSPAIRAKETVIPIAIALEYDTTEIYWRSSLNQGSLKDYLRAIKRIQKKYKEVLIVGHSYGSSMALNYVQKDTMVKDFPHLGIAAICFESKDKSWSKMIKSPGKLLYFDKPKYHRAAYKNRMNRKK